MKEYRRIVRAMITLALAICFWVSDCAPVLADQIKNADVFLGAQWDYVTGWTVSGEKDWLQSMCETDKYIVCFQDSKVKGQADVITVFDRWSYETLFEVRERDYEHGNGMTYNSQTNEVIIAPYNCDIKANKGKVFILDGDTLKYKREATISDGSWNAASLEYVEGSNHYIIQSTKENNYTFYVFDENFNYLDTLFQGNQSLGNLFQDFCVSGDFIISVPWMRGKVETPMLQLYSISQRRYLGEYVIDAPAAGSVFEPQSICQSDAGEIVMGIALSGTKRMALFNTHVSIIYTVTTSAENGEITPTRGDVDMGSDYKVEYNCTEDYELKQLVVDGEDVDINEYKNSYTFGNILSDHSIFAKFTEIPKFDITTSVTNGTIDESRLIRRDLDVTIHYQPDLHYEMDKLIIDGQVVDAASHETEYTFEYIQGPHSVAVQFKEIPSFAVSTQVYNGTITPTNPKVYRDENYTVEYKPEEDYELTYMKVDGRWRNNIDTLDYGSSYTFENMQKAHDIVVVFQWKYMPLVILAFAFALCIPIAIIYVAVIRIRKKRKKGARP